MIIFFTKTGWTRVCEASHNKTCLYCANNKKADQPVHFHSLISAFVVHCLVSIIYTIAITKTSSILSLISAFVVRCLDNTVHIIVAIAPKIQAPC